MEFLLHASLVLLLLSGACKPADTSVSNADTSMTSTSDYRKLAESLLGSKVKYALNEAKTLVLCATSEAVVAPAHTNSLRFLVIALKDNRIVYQDQMANAEVTWYNNTQLKIYTYPGTVQVKPNQSKNYYLYDIETKQKLRPGAQKL